MQIRGTELWHNQTSSELREFEQEPADDEIVIASAYSLISHGTERTFITGGSNPEIENEMRVPYMKGTFQGNFTYGYSLVGKVQTGGNLEGQWVHVMHPHASFAIVRVEDVFVVDELTPKVATLISNMETVLNAMWDARIEGKPKVAIVGFGLIGALLGSLIRLEHGIQSTILEVDSERRSKAVDLGFDMMESSPKGTHDICFHTSGTSQGLQSSIDAVGYEGKVIELSWYGNKSVELSFGGSFHYHRKKIISSQVSHIPGHMRKQWDYLSRKKKILEILKRTDLTSILDFQVPFEQTPAFYQDLRKGITPSITTLINY